MRTELILKALFAQALILKDVHVYATCTSRFESVTHFKSDLRDLKPIQNRLSTGLKK